MRNLISQLVSSARFLVRRPAFTAAVVLSLALGIGFASGLFTLVDAAFFQPLPVSEPDRLMSLYTARADDPRLLPVAYPDAEDVEQQSSIYTGFTTFQAIQVSLGSGDRPVKTWGQIVSPSFFEVFGVVPAHGRGFVEEEGIEGNRQPVVVIGHDLWSRSFGSDPGIVGREIDLNGHPFQVVGVAPPGFRGTDKAVSFQLWVPFGIHEVVFDYSEHIRDRSWQLFRLVGRLRSGATVDQARRELALISSRIEREHPETHRGLNLVLMPLPETALGVNQRDRYLRVTTFLAAIALILLLTACTNVASLLIAQSFARQREVTVRLSLGASRARVLRQLVFESLLLSIAGGAAGIGIAAGIQSVVRQIQLPMIPASITEATIDYRVLMFGLGVSLLTGLATGLAPAWVAARTDPGLALGRSREKASGRVRFASIRLLIGAQVALAFVSLTGAGLFLRSLEQIQRVDPGFDAERLAMSSFDLDLQGYDRPRAEGLLRDAIDRVSALPGVQSVALSENALLSGLGIVRGVVVEGREPPPGQPGALVRTNSVTPEFFETTSIPIVRGRAFSDLDHRDAPRVAVINQTMAAWYWPKESVIGKRFRFEEAPDEPVTVVGVARDAKYGTLTEDRAEYIYLPLDQYFAPSLTLIAQTEAEPARLLPSLTSAIQELDPALPVLGPTTSPLLLRDATWASRMASALLLLLGGVALVLAALGIYGIALQAVEQRRREMGIRMALGARRSGVLLLVLHQTSRVLAIGLIAGLTMSFWLDRWIRALLFGGDGLASNWDVLLSIAALLAVVTIAVTALPVSSRLSQDPASALRTAEA